MLQEASHVAPPVNHRTDPYVQSPGKQDHSQEDEVTVTVLRE